LKGKTMTTWTIDNLDRRTSDGFVTTAHWRATAVDGDHSASVYATCSWSEGQPTVPYANLTEQQVLAWVWESVDKAATEAALDAQIKAQKNPVAASGTPW
jgi:L-aminopeptidase/D-esterase-like protein